MPASSEGYLDFDHGNDDGLISWRASVQPEPPAEKPLELDLASDNSPLVPDHDPLAVWRSEQTARLHAIARREGLPIGETVRIVLQNALELSGRLIYDQATHHLAIGGVPFQKTEIVSCVRLE
jgi:hypothetical protein